MWAGSIDRLPQVAKVARHVDDEVFDEVLRTGDLSIADPGWVEGRTQGRDLGLFYIDEGLDVIPLPEFITGSASGTQAQLSQATFFTVSLYTVGYLLGYAEGLSGFDLEGAQEPTTEYEKGTQLGFAHGRRHLFPWQVTSEADSAKRVSSFPKALTPSALREGSRADTTSGLVAWASDVLGRGG